MSDIFKGEPINPFKEELDKIHGRIHDTMRGYTLSRDMNDVYAELHSILHVLESMGKKIGELSSNIHEIKNRSTAE